MRVKIFPDIFSDLVVNCSDGVTADTLASVMECGKDATVDWLKENARYSEVWKTTKSFLIDQLSIHLNSTK